MNHDETPNRMSSPQAVHLLMDMMSTAKNEFEIEALAFACRNLVKRTKDKKMNKCRRHKMYCSISKEV